MEDQNRSSSVRPVSPGSSPEPGASSRRAVPRIAIVCTLVYAAFFLWYTPLRGPLSDAEIEGYLSALSERGDAGARDIATLRAFLESDTGDDFVMLNALDVVQDAEGSGASELERYMAFMGPALLRRASHPVLGGSAASSALDAWGMEGTQGATEWSQGAAMRYRSRRDLMEIVTDPRFDDSHEFKAAALTKTIAFPLDPWFHLGDPRLLGGLLLVMVWLAAKAFARPQRKLLGPERDIGHGSRSRSSEPTESGMAPVAPVSPSGDRAAEQRREIEPPEHEELEQPVIDTETIDEKAEAPEIPKGAIEER